MKNEFQKAVDFRHACKIFDKTKKVDEDDMKYILNVGIKSPSSLGLEPWKFLVITDQELKSKLEPICLNQPQISSCSHLVILLADINGLRLDEVKRKFARANKDQDKQKRYIQRYIDKMGENIKDDKVLYEYASKQVYIASANLMLAAAILGIDSCPIAGFNKDELENALQIDKKNLQASLVIPFGYRLNPQPKKIRESFEKVVKYIK